MEALWSINNLTRYFPGIKGVVRSRLVGEIKAVDGVSFEVMPGETLGLVGESGCGKTTGRFVLRLLDPSGGQVYCRDVELTGLRQRDRDRYRRKLQIIFLYTIMIYRLPAEHKLEESTSWSKAWLTRDCDLLVDPVGFAAEGDPDEIMVICTSSSPSNGGRCKEPVVDQLCERQKVERDAQQRAQLVHDMQKRLMDRAWELMGLWWTRVEVRSARLHHYEPLPSHWLHRRLEDVWLCAR